VVTNISSWCCSLRLIRTHGRSAPLRPVILLHSSSPMLVGHPLTGYSYTNPLRHQTVFLLVFHEVDHLQTFLASLSSLVVHLSSCRCARIASISSALSTLLLLQSLSTFSRDVVTVLNVSVSRRSQDVFLERLVLVLWLKSCGHPWPLWQSRCWLSFHQPPLFSCSISSDTPCPCLGNIK